MTQQYIQRMCTRERGEYKKFEHESKSGWGMQDWTVHWNPILCGVSAGRLAIGDGFTDSFVAFSHAVYFFLSCSPFWIMQKAFIRR
jgi:hypothetical protein